MGNQLGQLCHMHLLWLLIGAKCCLAACDALALQRQVILEYLYRTVGRGIPLRFQIWGRHVFKLLVILI